MKYKEEPLFCPILALCEYEKLVFFVDNLTIYMERPAEETPEIATAYIRVRFQSILQYQFFRPLIIERSKKRKTTPMIVKPNYGIGKAKECIKFNNVKPLDLANKNDLHFIMLAAKTKIHHKGQFWQMGLDA